MGALTKALDAEIAGQSFSTATLTVGKDDHLLGARPLTPADFAMVNSKIKSSVNFQTDPTDFDGQIEMIVRKSHLVENDELGDKAFDRGDVAKLRRIGVEKISRLFADLFSTQVEMDDEDEASAAGNDE